MYQNQLVTRSSSFRGSLKALEADIHHANTLADSIQRAYGDGDSRISTYERRASLREFYAVIYPSLQQLESNIVEKKDWNKRGRCREIIGRKRVLDVDMEREDECGICLEVCTKMVLPSCNHAMCIKCYRDWNTRSQSCPFCRGSLKRVRSRDLWVLTSTGDMVDTATLEKENLRRFSGFIDRLPLTVPESFFLVYNDYLV